MLRASALTDSLDQYIKEQTFAGQMWTGASMSLLFFAVVAVYFYCTSNQDAATMVEKIDTFFAKFTPTPKQSIREDFGDYGAEAVRLGMDLDDPESPKDELRPQIWVAPQIKQLQTQVAAIRRRIPRTTSAPVFTVPLSPSDVPQKVW